MSTATETDLLRDAIVAMLSEGDEMRLRFDDSRCTLTGIYEDRPWLAFRTKRDGEYFYEVSFT